MQTRSHPGILRWLLSNSEAAWIAGLLLVAALVLTLVKQRRQARMTNPTSQPIFEIPDTQKSRAFAARNPHFPAALLKLFELANKCFGRDPRSKNQLENICFWLGHTCRQDFLEVVFLAVNGYGAGATKILRSLYERAVTIAYLIQNPDKVEPFLRFAAIQEKRAVDAALKRVPQSQIDAAMPPENRVAEVLKRYEQYKGNFKAKECKVCGARTPATWDIDLVSMVARVGEPYQTVFVIAYTSANFQIHATLASAALHDESREDKDAKTALIVATELLLAVIRSQNALFSLNLDADIEACTNDLRDAQARDLSET